MAKHKADVINVDLSTLDEQVSIVGVTTYGEHKDENGQESFSIGVMQYPTARMSRGQLLQCIMLAQSKRTCLDKAIASMREAMTREMLPPVPAENSDKPAQ